MKRIWLLLLATVLVVGCGGGSDSSSSGDGVLVADDEKMNLVLAEVAGQKIYGADVRYHMERTTGPTTLDTYLQNPDIVGVALAALVDQYVWAEMARRDGYELTGEEQRKLFAHETEFLATRYVADVVIPKATPPPEEVRTFYEENQHRYLAPARVAVRHILLPTQGDAEAMLARTRGGEDFAELAKRHSADEITRELGGALGYVQANTEILGIGKNKDFENTVMPLNPGETGLVQTQRGWHVVKVEKKEGGEVRPFEEVEAEITDQMIRREVGLVLNQELETARDATDTRVFGDVFGQFTGQVQNCARLMQMAEQHPDPEGRAELYRRVAFDFRDCDEAPRAQFMIGYVRFKDIQNPLLARKALERLEREFGHSEWAAAGRLLMTQLDIDPAEVADPEELLSEALAGNK